jgi:ADP-ribose pyrophosphatase YjhB (NUDIX family)
LPVALAAVVGPSGILLIRRAKEPFVGLWGLPGGKIEYGEHLDVAVEREVFEEAGIRAGFDDYRGLVSERVYEDDKLTAHYLMHVCRLRPDTGELRSSGEGEVRWFPVDDLDELQRAMIPSDRLILERLVFQEPDSRCFRCVIRERNGRYRVEEFSDNRRRT